jgi:5'-deoxynucleotidase YfbR-like HD superfamily hydrolase
MTQQVTNSISLYNGDFFDYDNVQDHDYDIDVIAHSLSNICRYGGHSNKFYSVAEHCVLVSRVVPLDLALCGLLHDASEAYCGDVCKPLKNMLPAYEEIEDRVQEAIANHFNLPFPFPKEIHLADKAVYRAERRQITNAEDKIWFTHIPEADVLVTGMDPKNAKNFFLSRYYELTSEHPLLQRQRAA